MSIETALAWLDGHVNLEATAGVVDDLSLDRMRALVGAMGDPQTSYPVVHVTGTNGKGSVARMVTALLGAHGLRVGTYTSPHLEIVNERLLAHDRMVSDGELAELVTDLSRLEPLVEPEVGRASWFELVTAAAFRWFADLAVDVAVVEVGLLGRFDATNVADGTVAVVTNVAKDHTDGRPGWREAIAAEKAGIVKPGSTLVLGETDPALVEVFAAEPAARTHVRGVDFDCTRNRTAVGGRLVDLRTPHGELEELFLPLHGSHQGDNAAAAATAASAFFDRALDGDVAAEAFATVELPGRFEVVSRSPLVVLDAAHNPAGAQAAARTLREDFAPAGDTILVVGMLRGRDPTELLQALDAASASLVVLCEPDSPRAVPAGELRDAGEALGLPVEEAPSIEAAVARGQDAAGEDDAVLVCGSLYVVGPARRALIGGGGAPRSGGRRCRRRWCAAPRRRDGVPCVPAG